MKKKIVIILILAIISLISINITGIYIQEKEHNKPIINGYINKEIIFDEEPFQSSYKYEKNIYTSKFDPNFENNHYYNGKDSDRSEVVEKYEKYMTSVPENIKNKINIKELFFEENYYYENDLSDNELKFYLYIYNPKEHELHYIMVVE